MNLIVIRNCIFVHKRCFLDVRSGEVYVKVSKDMGGDFLNCNTAKVMEGIEEGVEKQWVEFPSYSMTHVRQMYIQKLEKEKQHTITEYGLNNYPNFAIDQDNYEYISKCHMYCEDNRCEEDFWEYYDSYTLPIAQKWCERMGIVCETQ